MERFQKVSDKFSIATSYGIPLREAAAVVNSVEIRYRVVDGHPFAEVLYDKLEKESKRLRFKLKLKVWQSDWVWEDSPNLGLLRELAEAQRFTIDHEVKKLRASNLSKYHKSLSDDRLTNEAKGRRR